MMLTESEREWLRTRDKKRPFCFYCEAAFGTDFCYWKCVTESCAMYPDMKDAAEFSERVAAQLAAWETLPVPCMNDTYCDKSSLVCPSCRLKYARLQVEEEMDADIQAKD